MHKHTKRALSLAGLWAVSALAACGEAPQATAPNTDDLGGRAGLALTVDLLGETDIARISYTVTGVDCATGLPLDPLQQQTVVRDLEDLLIPGGNPGFENRPFDAASGHLFADSFFWLPEGCYDVLAQPLQESGEPSADCSPAQQNNVLVEDGQTTEIMLISQCQGDGAGGLDVITAINHAPEISNVQYEPSKFTCEDVTTICVTASDVDNDPVRVDWAVLAGDAQIISEEERELEDGSVQSCATFQLAGPGDYQVSATVFDLGYDSNGNLVTIQDLLKEGGSRVTSNDVINLPIHAMSADACVGLCECPEGFTFNEATEQCERFQTVEVINNNAQVNVCAPETININYGALGVRFPGADPNDINDDTVLNTNPFFGPTNLTNGGFNTPNGSRVQQIGIWACDAEGNPTAAPTQEWIGFASCVQVPEAGEYVVGISGDNRVRVTLNGTQIFSNDSGFDAYRHMWMVPVQLPAGSSIIEIEGLNEGGPAILASEIYGPFAVGSTANDTSLAGLDYANSVIWSTGDQLGGAFLLGEDSGLQCEDGFALDICQERAVCTRTEVLACE